MGIKILNTSLPRGAGTKYCPIPTSPPLRGEKNQHGVGWGGAGQSGAGRGKIAIPTQKVLPFCFCENGVKAKEI